MPGFSENPQPNRSGEKSEKPDKAERGRDTVSDVPEDVKEGKGKEEKSDIEKLKNQESYEEVYEVEIDGETYEVPVQVSYFEYPEHIQEDTGGVLGYERKQIDWNKLEEILQSNDMFKENKETNFRKAYEDAKEKRKKEQEILEKERVMKKAVWRVIETISGDQFPSQTCNHAMWSVDWRDKLHQKEGFGAQKVYGPENLAKRVLQKQSTHISTHNRPVIYNTNEAKEVEVSDIEDLSEKQKLEEKVRQLRQTSQKVRWFVVGGDGISAARKGRFWTSKLPDLEDNVFGFGRSNKAFLNYLNKAIDVLKSIDIDSVNKKKQLKTARYFLDDNYEPDFHLSDSIRNHPWIPVINSHKKLPEFSWCHAEYAYIPTEDNLNVVRFISKDMDIDYDFLQDIESEFE